LSELLLGALSEQTTIEPSASSGPGEGSLDDPSFGQDDEALSLIGAFDDLDVHALENAAQRILELRPLISAIGVELQKEGIEAEQRRHQEHAAVAVLNIGAMHDGVHQEALRVDETMPLLAFDLLARIVPMRVVSPPFSALFTLWLSMMAAVAEASRSALSRHST
jgi:hypothetical protein